MKQTVIRHIALTLMSNVALFSGLVLALVSFIPDYNGISMTFSTTAILFSLLGGSISRYIRSDYIVNVMLHVGIWSEQLTPAKRDKYNRVLRLVPPVVTLFTLSASGVYALRFAAMSSAFVSLFIMPTLSIALPMSAFELARYYKVSIRNITTD